MKINRWFLRCADCLEIRSTEHDPTYMQVRCDCGGLVSNMGRVTQAGTLIHQYERCACDGKCTHAKGPNCDCSCGGHNHGKGTLVCITIEGGSVPTVRGGDPKVAEEFRTAKAAAKSRFESMPFYADWMQGIYIPRDAWDRLRETQSAYNKARCYLTHTRRMKALARVAA
jgi:hypothetical protein